MLTAGLAAGALVYFIATRLLDRATRSRGQGTSESSGLAITVGAAIDGIPESLILGTSLVGGASVPLAFFAAVAI